MSTTPGPFTSTIGNVSNSQVAVGHGSSISVGRLPEADNEELRKVISGLRTRVAQEAPPEMQAAAEEQIQDLEKAIADDDEPDLGRMESVIRWFKRRLPTLAGAVLSVVVHPIVGRLVEAGGDALVEEFDRRFKAP